jgi:nucleoside-diphosphate-sugar epimerase
MTRVLVVGGTGFIGRAIAKAQRAEGVDVTTLGRRDSADIQADLTRSVPRLEGFDRVVVAFGLAHTRDAAALKRMTDVNVGGTRALLDALSPPREIALISSVSVYGASAGIDLDEGTPRRATEPYGVSRREVEDVVTAWCSAHGVRLGVARLPLVAGDFAPGNFGAMLSAMRARRYVGVGRGEARRSMVWVDDVANVITQLASRGGVYHLTDGDHPSFRELERAIATSLGVAAPRHLPRSVARIVAECGEVAIRAGLQFPFDRRAFASMTSTLTFSDAAARHALGWSPTRVVDRVMRGEAASER